MKCDLSFLFITSRDTGTGMLINRALTSKEIMVSSELMFFPLRLAANLWLSLIKEMFLPVYLCKILVRNLESLYVDVPQADIIGLRGTSGLCFGNSIECSRETVVPRRHSFEYESLNS